MKKTAWLLLCILLGFSWARAQTRKSESMVTIAGESYYVHTVEPGETLYSLGKAYGTDEQAIRRNNPHTAEGLKTGQVLKIPVVRQEPQKPLSGTEEKATVRDTYGQSGRDGLLHLEAVRRGTRRADGRQRGLRPHAPVDRPADQHPQIERRVERPRRDQGADRIVQGRAQQRFGPFHAPHGRTPGKRSTRSASDTDCPSTRSSGTTRRTSGTGSR